MNLTKTIKFYSFQPQPALSNNGITPLTTFGVIKQAFPKCDSYTISINGESYVIDILEEKNDYIFGKCAKENELSYTRFYQTRDKHTNKTEPYQSNTADTQLEVYTFFCIDCLSNRMAAIQHKNISKLNEIISSAIEMQSKNTLIVSIYPEKIKDIKRASNKIKKNPKLTIAFAKNKKEKYNIDSLAEVLGGISYDEFSISIKLNKINKKRSIDNLLSTYQGDKESFSSLKLSGKNEFGYEETVDFIETLYTQTTSFDLSDDFVKNYDIIKEKLIQSLSQKQ